MGVLENGLLEWAKQQLPWQQDVLRRLAKGEVFTRADYRVCADEAERGALKADAAWCTPPAFGDEATLTSLDAAHLTATVAGGEPVRTAKILHLQGANGLAAGASLEFRLDGLTIIAGKNGSGKSGYTRILKQVAATRASERVLPNAFNPSTVPKAVVSFQLGSAQPASELTWASDTRRVESPMQRVRVFDSRSASVHLTESTEVAYVPPILEIISEYTQILQEVSAVISADIQTEQLKNRAWPTLELGLGLDIFEHLGEQTSFDCIGALNPFTTEELAELENLPARLHELTSSNPAALAVQARQRAAQLNGLGRNLELVANKLAPDCVEATSIIRSDLVAAEVDVANARLLLEKPDMLPGTGSEPWREMWLAAQQFVAHDEHYEMNSHDGNLCPLCAQPLDSDAESRMALFSKFMNGEAQVKLSAAQSLRATDLVSLRALPLDSLITQELVDLVGTYDTELSSALLSMIGEATELCTSLIARQEDSDVGLPDPAALNDALVGAVTKLRAAASVEDEAAAALANADASALAVAQLTARRSELAVRQGLYEERQAIGEQHDRAIRVARFELARSSCATVSASRKNSALSKDYVEKVCHSFEVEATALGLNRVPVELVFDGSSRGVSYIKVQLKGAPQIPVASVLSEGEQRMTAIAGFFADLTESGDTSTLVFDDPVSSLDQEYRVQVARRLLREAESRQVLVFTHDFSFVQYLYEEKSINDKRNAAAGLPAAGDPDYIHITRSAMGAGVVTAAESWRHVSLKERLGRLRDRHQAAAVLYRNGDTSAYEKELKDIVGSLRETWEVFVEQELLNNVVTRHERSVQTQRLAKVADLNGQDVASVELGMSVASRYMTGHAAPGTDGSAAESPEWLIGEIDNLSNFRKTVLARRR